MTSTRIVEASGIAFGQVAVFSQHTTAAIKINEHEPLLLRDLARTLRNFAPPNAYYEHNDFSRRTVNMNPDECANGHAHVQHLFLGAARPSPSSMAASPSAPGSASSSSSSTTRACAACSSTSSALDASN